MSTKEWCQDFYILCQEVDTPKGPALVKIEAELSSEPIRDFKTASDLAVQYHQATGVRVFVLRAIIGMVVPTAKIIPMFTDVVSSHYKE